MEENVLQTPHSPTICSVVPNLFGERKIFVVLLMLKYCTKLKKKKTQTPQKKKNQKGKLMTANGKWLMAGFYYYLFFLNNFLLFSFFLAWPKSALQMA